MDKYGLLLLVLIFSFAGIAQEITPNTLLARSIEYHDPTAAWESFRGTLFITTSTPNNSNRYSEVTLDFPSDYFKLVAKTDTITTTEIFNKGKCSFNLNGRKIMPKKDSKSNDTNCGPILFMKNYYTYLYGLPMKLRDKGSIVHPVVFKKTFQGKEYLVLKVSYKENVGKDTWFFYFDPLTYAMKVYQFYHEESQNDGEFVLLDGIEEVKGIKIPKKRSWYTNKESRLLGIDLLTETRDLD